MTALQEAFERVGMMARQAQRKPTLVLSPIPSKRAKIQDRLIEDRAAFAAMSDDDLAFEQAALTENLEAIRIELRLDGEGLVEHEHGWRPRAERATAMIRGRMALCKLEIDRRQKPLEEERRLANQQREAEQRAARAEATAGIVRATEAKTARLALHEERERGLDRRFIRHAQQMLPEETYLAIWAAVNAEAPQ